jgi:site-specific recombinase XerD
MTALSPLLETFFTERLISQRRASPHTVASYRDAWCLLLEYAQVHLDIQPAALRLEDLDAPFIGAFLDHLERVRKNSVRTRNARLAAVRSFFRFASLRVPEHGGLIARVLAIPDKRRERAIVCFLDEHEVTALLAAPDRTTPFGRRDHALLALALQTGLRVSELTGLCCGDLVLTTGAARVGAHRSPLRRSVSWLSGPRSASESRLSRSSRLAVVLDSAPTPSR